MLKEYKVEVEANKLQISYRELLAGSHREEITFVRKIAGEISYRLWHSNLLPIFWINGKGHGNLPMYLSNSKYTLTKDNR